MKCDLYSDIRSDMFDKASQANTSLTQKESNEQFYILSNDNHLFYD